MSLLRVIRSFTEYNLFKYLINCPQEILTSFIAETRKYQNGISARELGG